jgi:hypothetical protein
MKSIFVAATVALTVTGAAASAQETVESAESAETQEAQQDATDKRICRTTKMTGSLTRRTRICMTESEWRELANRTRKGLEEMGQSASGGTAVVDNPSAGGN